MPAPGTKKTFIPDRPAAEQKAPNFQEQLKAVFHDIEEAQHEGMDRVKIDNIVARVFEHSVEDGLTLAERLRLTPDEYMDAVMRTDFGVKHEKIFSIIAERYNNLNRPYGEYEHVPKHRLDRFSKKQDVVAEDLNEIHRGAHVASFEEMRYRGETGPILKRIDTMYAPLLATRQLKAPKELALKEQEKSTKGERIAKRYLTHVDAALLESYHTGPIKDVLPEGLSKEESMLREPIITRGELDEVLKRHRLTWDRVEKVLPKAKYTLDSRLNATEKSFAEHQLIDELNADLEPKGKEVELDHEKGAYEIVQKEGEETTEGEPVIDRKILPLDNPGAGQGFVFANGKCFIVRKLNSHLDQYELVDEDNVIRSDIEIEIHPHITSGTLAWYDSTGDMNTIDGEYIPAKGKRVRRDLYIKPLYFDKKWLTQSGNNIVDTTGKIYGPEFDRTTSPAFIRGGLHYVAYKGGTTRIVRDEDRKIVWFGTGVVENLTEINGKIFFERTEKKRKSIEDEEGRVFGVVSTAGYSGLGEPIDVGGKMFFEAQRDHRYFIVNEEGNEIGGGYENAYSPFAVNGELYYIANEGKNSSYVTSWDGKKYGTDLQYISQAQEVDGKLGIVGENKDGKMERQIIDVKGMEKKNERMTMKEAKEILGKDFLGPEAIMKTFDIHLDARGVPPIPFSREELERAKELGQFLILRLAADDYNRPMTMERMAETVQPQMKSGKNALYSTSSNLKGKFLTSETPKTDWALVSKEAIPGSMFQDYVKQTKAIVNYLKNGIYKGKQLPKEYENAINEFEKQKEPFIGISDLEITRLCRQSAAEAMYDIIVQFHENHERLLENTFTWTRTQTIDDNHFVCIGDFKSPGVFVKDRRTDAPSKTLGVTFSRYGTSEGLTTSEHDKTIEDKLKLLNTVHDPDLDRIEEVFKTEEYQRPRMNERQARTISEAIKSVPEYFLQTLAAKRDRAPEILGRRLFEKMFPESIVRKKPLGMTSRIRSFFGMAEKTPTTDPTSLLNPLNAESLEGGGDAMEKDDRHVMEFREPMKDLMVSSVYGKYDKDSRQWRSSDFTVTTVVGDPSKETTVTLPTVKGLNRVALPKPVDARIIAERVKGVMKDGKEIPLKITEDHLGNVTAENAAGVEKIVFSMEYGLVPEPMRDVTDKDYAAFAKKFTKSNGVDLTEPLAPLPEDVALMFATPEFQRKSPKERVIEIERLVRELGYYDTKNEETAAAKRHKPIEEQIVLAETRANELRAAGNSNVGDKRFAGVCADFANITTTMLRRAGFVAGVATGLMPEGDTAMVKDSHAASFVVWPTVEGANRIVIVDGTPGSTDSRFAHIERPTLEQQEAQNTEEVKKVIEEATKEVEKTLEVIKSKDEKAIRALKNGKLEEALNIILHHEVKESHTDTLSEMMNFYWYGGLQRVDPLRADTDLRHAMEEDLVRQRGQSAERKTEERHRAGTRLFKTVETFVQRFMKAGVSSNPQAAFDLIDHITDLARPALSETETRAIATIVTYLRAKKVAH